jgi:hydroxyacylglutathione hydrolase
MLRIQSFTFNPFQENTYVIWDSELLHCAIVDAGCYTTQEQDELYKFITLNKLNPVVNLNTHAHIDHVLGNAWVKNTFNIPLALHKEDLSVLHSLAQVASMYAIPATPSPEPEIWLKEGNKVLIGKYEMQILFVPGHSPGSVAFYNEAHKMLVSGDVLFKNSIGRTDLPGGDYYTLLESISNKVLTLPADTKVYSGHGEVTSIGYEKKYNPFVLEYLNR